ncbi:MAG: cell division protein FtsX, partial [Alphaproteobacteria bacterium]
MKRPAPRTRIIGRDSATRTMPWMVAVMAFVAALALALSLAVEAAAARFGAGLAGSVTVEVPAAETPAAGEARAAAAAAALRTVPGVLSAAVIAREATARLVEPWLGADLAGGALPLPVLIDLRVDPSQPPAPGALATALARVGPDISVDDHRLWLDRLLAWVDAVRLGALAVLACAVVGIVLTVALATRAALAIHRDVIEILHMIGAQDRYIARQFQ